MSSGSEIQKKETEDDSILTKQRWSFMLAFDSTHFLLYGNDGENHQRVKADIFNARFDKIVQMMQALLPNLNINTFDINFDPSPNLDNAFQPNGKTSHTSIVSCTRLHQYKQPVDILQSTLLTFDVFVKTNIIRTFEAT